MKTDKSIKEFRHKLSQNKSTSSIQDGINSDANLFAQSAPSCGDRSRVDALESSIKSWCKGGYGYSLQVRYIIWFLLHTGARVSEILNLKSNDISGNYVLRIRAAKGSNDRIVNVPEIPGQPLKLPNSNIFLFQDFNRFFIYRLCKTQGFYFSKIGNSNAAVTHSFRNLYAYHALKLARGEKVASKALGHRNIHSIEAYDNIE